MLGNRSKGLVAADPREVEGTVLSILGAVAVVLAEELLAGGRQEEDGQESAPAEPQDTRGSAAHDVARLRRWGQADPRRRHAHPDPHHATPREKTPGDGAEGARVGREHGRGGG
uniref:DUF2335 domain-containing protein n=1 Tax=Steinernema glaseri TaxID=37863 RepID=A0A1I7ZX96_9BILA